MYPYSSPNILAKGLSAIKSIKWGALLEGTSKTLNVVNQAIPIIYQVKPIFGNMKTLMKIATGLQENEPTTTLPKEEKKEQSTNQPIFYIE